jgi:tetratricopeptide (TPR) repeat protein
LQVVLPPEAFRPITEVEAPPGLVNLPHRTDLFVGRTDELLQLDAALAPTGRVVVHAVHGLGGVGKSALAARWAALHADEHSVTWSISADTPADIEEGLARLASALQPELADAPMKMLTERAVQWLACHDRWLLVLDNVQRPADIQWLLARATTGKFVVTSRLAIGWHPITAAVIRLDVLSDTDAVELLTRIVSTGSAAPNRPGPDLDGAAELCGKLGNLPLAVEQAAAFIRETQITPHTYMELLAKHPARMYDQAAEGGNAERTIARIWRVSLDRLAATPLAGQLLRILGWYAIDGIPRTVLDTIPDPALVQLAIGRLAAYNLITISPDGALLIVHRLVQAIARTPDPTDPYRQTDHIQIARNVATRLLAAAVPADTNEPARWPEFRALLPHIAALTEHAEPSTDTEDTAYLLNRVGDFLDDQGAPARAVLYHVRAHRAAARVLGADDPFTLVAGSCLAQAHAAAGNVREAITIFENVLEGLRNVWGEDGPATLRCQNNLAGAYLTAGYLTRSIALYEQTVTQRVRALGEDHPATRRSRSDLALAYAVAGDLRRAIQSLEQLLIGDRRELGPEHPNTLSCQSHLAQAYQKAGDLARAIPLHEQTLAQCRGALGEDYPETLLSRINLASAYQEAGQLPRAISLYEETMTRTRRALGSDHPITLTSQNGLAFAYKSAGHLQQAISLYKETLANSLRISGKDHPTTLACQLNLATAYEWAGQVDRAIRSFKQALAEHQRVLGNDHPITLGCQNNLAHAYQAANDLARALPLFEQTLADRRRVLGEDHPDTLTSSNNLAYAYQLIGDLPHAISLHQQTLGRRQRVLSGDHPDITQSRINLAADYEAAGQTDRAIPLLEQVAAHRQRALDADDPDTFLSRMHLAAAYLKAGEILRAIPLFRQALTDLSRVLGEDHPHTRMARVYLATAYLKASNVGRAIPLIEQVATQRRMQGNDLPPTAQSHINQAAACYAAGDPARASTLLTGILGQLMDNESHDEGSS